MTETGAGAWITANHEPRHVGQRCFGQAPPGLAYRIVDDARTRRRAGSGGRVAGRRDGGTRGADSSPDTTRTRRATQQAWAGGWFHTGDLVRVGADGSFFFVDRSKNVIRRSGENIAAVEVESALQAHARCARVGRLSGAGRGARRGSLRLRRAASRRRALGRRSRRSCRATAGRRSPTTRSPGYIGFRQELPQTASQKLARARIKEQAAGAVGAGEAFDLRQFKSVRNGPR